ncbi:hypothetical protein [Sphingobium fluviale]|uniref:Uncharacterized protein n=1 Tax=Sphingobium fluviale TaxID=2506423 RepID=A0A4Q1KFR0_9SPHN|nr:hypothetical protein [Sphingobium fluviale]RXR28272.1 hypothetical protein EQG66_11020 [Sphingobium fluviale]
MAAISAAMSRFLHLDAMQSSELADASATAKDSEGFEDPPELVPTFMPTVRRVLSRFMNPAKKRSVKNRRARGLRALLARTGFRSKFLAQPSPPPAPKPAPPKPPKPVAQSATSQSSPRPQTLRGKFNMTPRL